MTKRTIRIGDVFDPGILPNLFFVVTHVPHDQCAVDEPNHRVRVVPATYSLGLCDENDIIGFTQKREVMALLTYLDAPVLSGDLGVPVDFLGLDDQLLKALLINLQDAVTGGFTKRKTFARTTSDGVMRSTAISDGKQVAWYIVRERIPDESDLDNLKFHLFREILAGLVQQKICID